MNYFTADTHFSIDDYSGTVLRDFRPFKSCKQMNRQLIKSINKRVKRGDVLYHLGDFINYNRKDSGNYDTLYRLIKKIRASVVLVLGNNDRRALENEFGGDFEKFKAYLLELGFKDVIEKGTYIKIGDTQFYLTHEPKDHIGDKNLFGHIHSLVMVKRYGYNVGVDVNHFFPFSESDILMLEEKRAKYYDENVYD